MVIPSDQRACHGPQEEARFEPGRFDRTALPQRPRGRCRITESRSRQQLLRLERARPEPRRFDRPAAGRRSGAWHALGSVRAPARGIAGAEACDGLRENTADRGSRSRHQLTAAGHDSRSRQQLRGGSASAAGGGPSSVGRPAPSALEGHGSRSRKVKVTAAGHGSSSSVCPCSDSGGFRPGRDVPA